MGFVDFWRDKQNVSIQDGSQGLSWVHLKNVTGLTEYCLSWTYDSAGM